MCNAVEESSTHLFLLCPFARAIWHGSTLSIHTFEFSNLSIHQWLKSILFNHKGKDDISMAYLQAVFTTLWSIWTYRNRVIHQGICPNPLEVILMAQSLSCRYRSTFFNSAQDLIAAATTPSMSWIAANHKQCLVGPWDLVCVWVGVCCVAFQFLRFLLFFFFFSRVFSPQAATVHVQYMNSSRNF